MLHDYLLLNSSQHGEVKGTFNLSSLLRSCQSTSSVQPDAKAVAFLRLSLCEPFSGIVPTTFLVLYIVFLS